MHLYVYALLVISYLTSEILSIERNQQKRQIYREQVLPHAGGRIPETAFETDRLLLNHLQKEGIAVPDGVVFEQRNPQVYPFLSKPSRTVFRIALSSDGRYTARGGRYIYNDDIPSVETTYLYPQIHGNRNILKPPAVVLPIYRQLQLHNAQLNPAKLQPKSKGYDAKLLPSAETYQNFNIINTPPVVPVASAITENGNSYHPNYIADDHQFNHFQDLFNNKLSGHRISYFGGTNFSPLN